MATLMPVRDEDGASGLTYESVGADNCQSSWRNRARSFRQAICRSTAGPKPAVSRSRITRTEPQERQEQFGKPAFFGCNAPDLEWQNLLKEPATIMLVYDTQAIAIRD